jgi:hypothetical protein
MSSTKTQKAWKGTHKVSVGLSAHHLTYLRGHVEDLTLLGADNLLQRLGGNGSALRHLVKLGNVSTMVLLVMELNGLGRDVRSESSLLVRERGECEGHVVKVD